MNQKKTIAVLAIAMMAFISLGAMTADDSDAYVTIENEIRAYDFTNNGSGTLEVLLRNGNGTDMSITITVTRVDNGAKLAEGTFNVPGDAVINTEYTAKLQFKISDAGDHEVLVTCTPANLFLPVGGEHMNTQKMTITVTESIWSKWTTYAAVAVVVILILIAVFMKMRSVPATKPDTTFTELEKQRDKPDGKEPEAPKTTKRVRYEEPSTPAPAKKEAKPASFTELDKQKKSPEPVKEPVAEPRKEPKKDSDSKPPEKLKYKSSRRK